jgi:hypothetical protein
MAAVQEPIPTGVLAESPEHLARIAELADLKNWDALARERFHPGTVDIAAVRRRAGSRRPDPDSPDPVEWPTLDELYEPGTGPENAPISSLPFRTAAQLSTETLPDIDWTIQGIAAARAITEIVASIKTGKSTFIGHAVSCVLRGSPFLGLPTRQGSVIWLTEERPTTFRRLLERTNLLSEDDLWILALQDARGTAWTDMVVAATALAIRTGAVLLVVDTIGRLAGLGGDSENDAGAAQEAMAPLENAAANGLSIIIGRHARKAGGDPESVGRGSSAWSGISDVVIQLTKPGASHPPNVRKVSSVSRFEETPDEVLIQLDEDGYKLLGTEAAVVLGEVEDVILEALRLTDDLPQTEIFKLTDAHGEVLSRRTVQRALANLTLFHRVERLGAGGKRDPLRFSLKKGDINGEYHASAPVILKSSEVELEGVIPPMRVSRPYTEGGTNLRDTHRDTPQQPCPGCSGTAFSWGPEGQPQRRCHGCGEVWTP